MKARVTKRRVRRFWAAVRRGTSASEYEIEIVSEEGSGCEPYDYFELVNSSLPAGLSLSREGVISGVPTSAGVHAFLAVGSRPDRGARRTFLVPIRG